MEVKLHNNATYAKRYDHNGNLIEETQPNGFKVTSQFDALNRLIAKSVTLRGSAGGREAFEYDGLSRMTSAQNFDPFDNPIANVGYVYDSLSRVVAEIQNGRAIRKTYDGVGNILNRTYPSGRVVANSFDALNRLTAIQQTPTPEGILQHLFGADAVNILNASYIGKDRPQQFTFGNNTKTEFAYDSLKRLTSQLNKLPNNNVIAGFAYGYDKASNRLFEERQTAETTRNTFSYDSIYRLTQLTSPSVTNQWTLDKVDNWLERHVVIPAPEGAGISRETRYEPNEVNAYTTVAGTPYIYDESGNLTDDGTHIYQYNYRNLLTRVVSKSDGTEVASYGYDALGRRIFKTVNGEMTRFVYEGVHIIAEVSPNDSISKEFIYGSSMDDPISVIARSASDEAIYYYHKDGLGSTTALTNQTGEVVETYQYGPYGEPEIHDGTNGALLEQSAIGNNHLYTGQIYDAETGFYYYKARYYSPQLGRFLQRDPLGYVDGYNLYAYVNNNPLNWIDPLGMNSKETSKNSSAGNPGYIIFENNRGDIAIDPTTGHVVQASPNVMNSMQKEYYNARVDLDKGRVGAQEKYQSVLGKYAKVSPEGFNRAIVDLESVYQTGRPYRPTTTESLAYFGKLGGAMLGAGVVGAVGDAALLSATDAVMTYGPGAYAAGRAAAYSAYATAMTVAATPVAQGVLRFATEIGRGYAFPEPPQTKLEAAGFTLSIYDFFKENYGIEFSKTNQSR